MKNNTIKATTMKIEDRIRSLRPRLGGLITLGERALRYWVLREIFEDILGWPTSNIVVGERFDALLLDSRKSPIIYLETKALDHKILTAEHKQAKERFHRVHSLELMVFCNISQWSCHTKDGTVSEWSSENSSAFFERLFFKRYSG